MSDYLKQGSATFLEYGQMVKLDRKWEWVCVVVRPACHWQKFFKIIFQNEAVSEHQRPNVTNI